MKLMLIRQLSASVQMARRGVCEKLRSSLSSLCCESAIVTLTLVSALAISGEILVNYGILRTPSSKSAVQTTDGGQPDTDKTNLSQASPQSASDDRTMDIVESVFHYISLVIAGIFFVEILLKLAAFRMRFLVNPWQVLDMMVVLTAAMAEVAFEIEGRMIQLEACTYVIVFRLCRLPVTCKIKAKAVQYDLEQEIEVWKAGKVKMEDKCRSLEAKHNKQKEKLERLERELTTLKRDANEKHHFSNHSSEKQQASPPPPNGTVAFNKLNGYTSNHSPSAYHVTPDDKARDIPYATANSDNDTVDGTPRKIGRPQEDGDERETEEDTVDEEEEERGRGRTYFRSGSESSLSCQASEHEVHVQIEGQDQEGVTVDVTSQEEGSASVNIPVQRRHKDAGGEVYYDNSGYDPDIDNDPDGHGVLVHEFDGARTYQSAAGIPMTDL
ncbi:uncharacterized protein [Littorina saxatilis]|uniref:uncharacterized protein isoform X2 n=1 Tax=Littorina saxatilis TaxID=31220 RepID=UPI0038B60F76